MGKVRHFIVGRENIIVYQEVPTLRPLALLIMIELCGGVRTVVSSG
jgi:hypothetical protein